ncbi:MAG TPA: hypothetical protein VFS18_04405 [Actinomycetota bacterium]|nr:hypothetical protein [Actinomycetota bacterium]
MKVVVGSDIPHYTRSVGQFDNRMAYAVCLRELGHEVVVLADVYADRIFDADYRPGTFEDFEGRRDFAELAEPYGPDLRYALIYDGGTQTEGMSFDEAVAEAASADVLINIGGKLKTQAVVDAIPVRIFVDLSPAKTQAYESEYGLDQGLSRHHVFFTVGRNIGRPDSVVPTCGVDWHPWMHPVPLAQWPEAFDTDAPRFSTISGWMGKETFVLDGRYSGEKSNQWEAFIDAPVRSEQEMEIALRLPPGFEEDERRLRSHGWELSDPLTLRTLADYQRFVATSRGEFTVANQRYTEYRTGWFSERSARYLASGKPVIMQSTGFEDHVPAGLGYLTYRTIDEAVDAVRAVNSDYEAHCRAARAIAVRSFDGTKLLAEMLEIAGR